MLMNLNTLIRRRNMPSTPTVTAQDFLGHPPRRRRICVFCCVKKWKELALLGISCFALAGALFTVLAFTEGWVSFKDNPKILTKSRGVSPSTTAPDFFQNIGVPQILVGYTNKHNAMTSSPFLPASKFVYFECPGNASSLAEALLSLTSAFLFSILTERALLVNWKVDNPILQYGHGNETDETFATSSLDELFVAPDFQWSWLDFQAAYLRAGGSQLDITPYELDINDIYEDMMCQDLKTWLGDHKVVSIKGSLNRTSLVYFTPFLQANAQFSRVLSNGLSYRSAGVNLFALLSNFLLRPVPSVITSISRFQERYFKGSYVVGVEISTTSPTSSLRMPDLEQQEFIKVAAASSWQVPNKILAQENYRGVVFYIFTDNEESVRQNVQALGPMALGNAGMVAITSAQGEGTTLFLSQLQNLWLLGLSNTIITTVGSKFGDFGHARTSQLPTIVLNPNNAQLSTSSEPCFSEIKLIEQASCFDPSVLSLIQFDPSIPC